MKPARVQEENRGLVRHGSLQVGQNLDSNPGRVSYSNIRKNIFAALVTRSDVDFIALDKGEIINSKAIDTMMTTIEEYIKWGLDFISEQMEDDIPESLDLCHSQLG